MSSLSITHLFFAKKTLKVPLCEKSKTAQGSIVPQDCWELWNFAHHTTCRFMAICSKYQNLSQWKNYIQSSETINDLLRLQEQSLLLPVQSYSYRIMATVLHLLGIIWKIFLLLPALLLYYLIPLPLSCFYYEYRIYL